MSTEEHITVRISVPLILAQVIKSRTDLQDACNYIYRILSAPNFLPCSTCGDRFCYLLPMNDLEFDEAVDTDKWNISYDPDTTPSSAETASLDHGSDKCNVSIRGLMLTSQVFRLAQSQHGLAEEEHVHELTMSATIAAVFKRMQQFQLTADWFLYAPPANRMMVTIDHDNNDFPPETFDRVDRLLDCCARQYDFLTCGVNSSNTFDLFAFLSASQQQSAVESEVEERHPFETAIDFDQAPSTLDPRRVMAWIDILVKTVARCSAADQTFFDWQLSPQGEFGAPEFTSTALLCALDVDPDTLEFYFAKHPGSDHGMLTKAMNALSSGNPLGPLAMHVANGEISKSDRQSVSDKTKLKLLTGGYGMYPREYTRKALVAIGEEAAGNEQAEKEGREGVDFVFKTDPGRLSILGNKSKRATCIW